MKAKLITVVAAGLVSVWVSAQHNYIPLSSALNDEVPATGTHRSIWPARLDLNSMDSARIVLEASLEAGGFWDKNWVYRKLTDQHLIDMSGDDWSVFVDPVLQVYGGMEVSGEESSVLGKNSRGFHLEGRLGKQFTFESTLVESQYFAPEYLTTYIRRARVVPGEGIANPFYDNGWDHRWASGSISYTPSRFFNISAGQGKFFYGEGYRSMILSDNALNYPYLRIETTFGPFKYVNLWTQMYDIRREVNLNPGNRRKWISNHYLSWNVTERFNLSFFESVVYGSDTTNGGLDISFFNPVILYRPIEDQIDSRTGNILLGMGSSYHFPGGHRLYGQLVLDEFRLSALAKSEGSWLNKIAFQLGYGYDKHFGDHFVSGLIEFNKARAFTYSHKNVLTNYAHFGQPIAHPLGTDFQELVFRLRWRKGRWSSLLHYSVAQAGLPNVINGQYFGEGADLWTPYYNRSRDNGFGSSDDPTVAISNMRWDVAWMAQTAWKLELFAEFALRNGPLYPAFGIDGTTPATFSSTWFNIGFRTQLYRTYSDI